MILFLVDSQAAVNRNLGTDTDNDIIGGSRTPSNRFYSFIEDQSDSEEVTAQSYRREQIQPMAETINCDDFINENAYENADEEWPIGLAQEVENEENGALYGRLTEPPSKVRLRNRPSRSQDDITTQLRANPLELVNQQLNLQEVLQGEAREKGQVVTEHSKLQKMLLKERLKAAIAKRREVEIRLRLMEIELQNKSQQ